MIQKIRKYIEEKELLPKNKPHSDIKIIVGFSGGADSAVLLFLLDHLGYSCIAAHCNFHLRGEESLRDEKVSEKLAAGLNIPFIKQDFDTIEYAKRNSISIEMAARALRYEWFEKICLQESADCIAIAHHSDDNVETFFLNIIRGTGIRGLTAISPKNGKIIRPLLGVSKEEILDFAHRKKITYVTDSTNLQDEFIRNKIRLTLLPFLKTINPSIDASILRTIENITEVHKIYETDILNSKKEVFNELLGIIDVDKLKKTASPEATLFEILKEFSFDRDTVKNIVKAINSQSGKEFHSPCFTLIKDRNRFLLTPRGEKENIQYYIHEPVQQTLTAPLSIELSFQKINESFEMIKNNTVGYFDADKLEFPLVFRKWEKGDKFVPLGMTGFQKLSDFFNNNKVSKPEKEKTWLLCSGNNIIWIIGYRIDNRYRIDKETQRACIVKLF